MQETHMKRVYIIIFISWFALYSIGQNRFTSNPKLTDKVEAISDSIDLGNEEALLSVLIEMRDSLEHTPVFDAYNYVHVVWCMNKIFGAQENLEKYDNSIKGAFSLFEKKGKKDDPCLRTLYLNRGTLWQYLDNLSEAKKDFIFAKNLYEQTNDTTEEYAVCLMNLSTVLVSGYEAYDLVNSRLYLEEAKEILDNYFQEKKNAKNAAYYYDLNNIAMIYVRMGDWAASRGLLEEILASTQELDELFRGIRVLATNNLCYCLIQEQKYEEASIIAKEAIKDIKEFRAKEPMYQNIILSLNQANDPAVDEWLSQYNKFVRVHVSDVFSSFSEREREAYWTDQAQALLACNNVVANKGNRSLSLIMAYDNAIYTKSMLLESNSLLPKIINKSGNPELINSYKRLISLKDKLNDKNTHQDSILDLQKRINIVEKKLISSISNFGEQVVDEIPSYQMVRGTLGKKEVAIEFIVIPEIDERPYKYYYGALIARADYENPVLVRICEMDTLDERIENQYGKIGINDFYDVKNDTIYQLLWKPLEPYLRKGDNVYCSLVGELSKINLAALSNGKKRLMDIYNVSILTSTGNLVEMKAATSTGYKSALIYGGIDYSESPEDMAHESERVRNSFSDFLATRSIDVRGNWSNLAATGFEAAQIETELSSNNVNTIYLSGRDANEESFKSLNGNAPDILHIATHGFFFPEPKNRKAMFFNNLNSYTQKGESMFYSGLLFAGANNVWNGVNVRPDVDDGVLTADEVSRVDLSNCKLVVLSACNTGLGTVDIVDGVFGLQRGFKQAGVGCIVMSLWKVDDQATAELMIAFYQSLNAGNTPHKALDLAKRKLIKDKRFHEPYYWAAFVLLD